MNSSIPLAFLGGGPGFFELCLVFVAILVVFGPRRLPEIARTLGRMLHELTRASQDFKDQVMSIETEVTEEIISETEHESATDDEEGTPHES